MGGRISGAHYNPAVTLAIYMRKKIEAKDAMMYMIFQITGAFLAAVVYHLVKGHTFAPTPAEGFHYNLKPLMIEMLFTFALTMVILYVATHSKISGNSFYGIAIGATVMAVAFVGGPVSGGAYNPAVAIGPILVDTFVGGSSLNTIWIYLVGPFVGSAVAAIVYTYMNPEEK